MQGSGLLLALAATVVLVGVAPAAVCWTALGSGQAFRLVNVDRYQSPVRYWLVAVGLAIAPLVWIFALKGFVEMLVFPK
jgi:hypothetical protein